MENFVKKDDVPRTLLRDPKTLNILHNTSLTFFSTAGDLRASSYEPGPGWLGFRDLGFCDLDLGNRDENFPM